MIFKLTLFIALSSAMSVFGGSRTGIKLNP
jgi:hypothetical protein